MPRVHVPFTLEYPWPWLDNSDLHQACEPCLCHTSSSPPAGAPRREGGALAASILVASRVGGAGSPGELLPGAGVQVGWAGVWDRYMSLAWRAHLPPGIAICSSDFFFWQLNVCTWNEWLRENVLERKRCTYFGTDFCIHFISMTYPGWGSMCRIDPLHKVVCIFLKGFPLEVACIYGTLTAALHFEFA